MSERELQELKRKHDFMSTAWKAILTLHQDPPTCEEDWSKYLFIFENKYDLEELPQEEKDFVQDLMEFLLNQVERRYRLVVRSERKRVSKQEYDMRRL